MRFVLLGSLAVIASASALAQDGAEPFTRQERALLRAGELVARPLTRNQGGYSYVGGTSWQLVRAPVERVWRTVLDTSAYPRLIPSLAEVEVVREQEDERLVRMRHVYSFASASYFARVRIDRDRHRLVFDLDRDRPHDLRAGRGFLELSPYRGDTIVSWGVLADIGAGVVQHVFGPFLHEWMLEVPRNVRREVELGHLAR